MYNLLIDAHALVHTDFHLLISFTDFYHGRTFKFIFLISLPLVSLGIYLELKSLFSTKRNYYITFQKMSQFSFTI